MSSIRLYHAKILTMEEDAEAFDGEVHIDGNRISYVGENNSELNKRKFTREIDCEGNLLMPGFKNAHTHSAMTFLRSYADDLPLQNWLNDRVFPMEAKLQKGDIEILSKVAVLEYLTSGITSNFDMYVDNYQHAKTSVQMGFRTVFCGELNNFTGSLARTREEYEMLNKGNELVSFRLGVHAEYTTSRELLEGMAELAHEYKQPVYLHLAETKKKWKNVKCVMVCHRFSFWIQLVCLTMAVVVSTVSGWMKQTGIFAGRKRCRLLRILHPMQNLRVELRIYLL